MLYVLIYYYKTYRISADYGRQKKGEEISFHWSPSKAITTVSDTNINIINTISMIAALTSNTSKRR